MFEVNDIPPIDGWDLQDLITENVSHEEFLFFRTYAGDENDCFLPDGYTRRYECFCTACQERFIEPYAAGPISKWTSCPSCNHKVTVKRWNELDTSAALPKIAFAFHFFQRGKRDEVWLSSLQVRMNPNFLDGKYIAHEYCRYVFFEGGSQKWSHGWDGWQPVKNTAMKRWTGQGGIKRDDFWILPSRGELAGTCLQYSQLHKAYNWLNDLPQYLALYVRYPAVEYLWKMGFGGWLQEREMGLGFYFRKVVNLRAREPKRLIPKLGKADIRLLLDVEAGIKDASVYQELRLAGIIRTDRDGYAFARAIVRTRFELFSTADYCGVTAKELRKYINRQVRRPNRGIADVIRELEDYHAQLDRMHLGGNRLPYDLHEAHARLSERERQLIKRRKNEKFRIRRRLLAWMKWKYHGMFIRPIDSAEEIVREGEEQDNCVAGYASQHANGETIIMVLRRCSEPRKPWHTVEIDPRTLECRQCYGYDNSVRTPEAAEFMEKYLDHLREVTKMVKRRSA